MEKFITTMLYLSMIEKVERNLFLYWYYIINEMFPADKQDEKIKGAMITLKDVYLSKFERDILEDPPEVDALVKLKLEVPKKYYDIDYKDIIRDGKAKNIEKDYKDIRRFSSGRPSIPTVKFISKRYKWLLPNPRVELSDNTYVLKAVDDLIVKLIPKPVLAHFTDFITSLINDDFTFPIDSTEIKSEELSNEERKAHIGEIKQLHDIIKKQSRKLKYDLGRKTEEELNEIAYRTRKKNGTVNYAGIARELGYHPTTVKAEFVRRGKQKMTFERRE